MIPFKIEMMDVNDENIIVIKTADESLEACNIRVYENIKDAGVPQTSISLYLSKDRLDALISHLQHFRDRMGPSL